MALSFRYATDGEEHLYDVCRSWKVSEGRLREELRVLQDGVPDQWLSDNWPQLVEDLFPLDISQLFFFDAEKIRVLAEDESSSKALGAAIKSLLGLDIVERLITDSTVLQARLAKKLGTPEHQAQVEALEQLAREHQMQLDAISTERAALENNRLRAETELKEVEEAFAAGGGRHWEARQERRRRLGEVASHEEALAGQLVTLAAGDLPLVLVPDLLSRVEEQDRRERQALGAEVIQRLLIERDAQLLEILRDARGSPDLLRRASEHLEADRLSRRPVAARPRRLELSEPARVLLRHLRGQRLANLPKRRSNSSTVSRKSTQEREDLERAIAAAPDDADISDIVQRLKEATEALTLLNEQAGQLDAAIAVQRVKLEECRRKAPPAVAGEDG